MEIPKTITAQWLMEHPNHIFVFGDNTIRKGEKGGAALRGIPNTYGFITKIYPTTQKNAYYTPDTYHQIFIQELHKLEMRIVTNPKKIFLISKLGSGLANKYGIFEAVIEPGLSPLRQYPNVVFLW